MTRLRQKVILTGVASLIWRRIPTLTVEQIVRLRARDEVIKDSHAIKGLPLFAGLVARKLAGPEKSKLEDADIAFHESEYQRLRGELQAAQDASQLPELPSDETRAALNDLLVRIRLRAK